MPQTASPLPGVTVVVPVYNYARYVAEAIRSAQGQVYAGALEILVVDDGSTDESPVVIGGFGGAIRNHRQINAGLSEARNTGMKLATHGLVVFLDADDLLEPTCVQDLVEAWMAEEVKPVVIGSRSRMIDGAGQPFTEPPKDIDGGMERFTTADFVLRNRFAPIVLADRQALLSLGGFDPQLAASEDRDMWIRACTLGPVLLRRVLHRKRDHGANMSRHAERQTSSILRVLEKAKQHAEIQLPEKVWAEAEAVCLFQSARMYLAAGERKTALRQCVRSLGCASWLTCAPAIGYPPAFRVRFLLLELGRLLGFGRESASIPLPSTGEAGELHPMNLKTR